jgi:hypothetical protein
MVLEDGSFVAAAALPIACNLNSAFIVNVRAYTPYVPRLLLASLHVIALIISGGGKTQYTYTTYTTYIYTHHLQASVADSVTPLA